MRRQRHRSVPVSVLVAVLSLGLYGHATEAASRSADSRTVVRGLADVVRQVDCDGCDTDLGNVGQLPVGTMCSALEQRAVSENWPEFRGPNGDGQSVAHGLPLTWNETQNIVWKTPIHDHGWSSPVIWQDQVWMTTATKDGRRLFAVCVDRSDGHVVHDVCVFEVETPEPIAVVNSYASPTPAIESGRLYVNYGTYGTACLDTGSGEILWTRRDLNCDHEVGPGASPILYQNLLIIPVDGRDVQYVVALDTLTGRTVWKTDRSIDLSQFSINTRKAFCTPTVIDTGERKELISPGAKAAMGYDPETGTELWQVRYNGWSMVPRPLYGHGLVFLVNDYDRPELWAIRPGGRGDVTGSHVLWRVRQGVPSQPSLLLSDGHLYAISDAGVVVCLHAETGEVAWRHRMGGNYSASPLQAQGRMYFFSQEGTTTVLEPGREYKVLAENTLDGEVKASPAVAGNSLFVRTRTHLYRIGRREPAETQTRIRVLGELPHGAIAAVTTRNPNPPAKSAAPAQVAGKSEVKKKPSPPQPTLSNVPYGEHERQVLDFYKVPSPQPTPLLFNIHGGGWVAGDKATVDFLEQYLAAGISFVSINYRYSTQAQLAGVQPPVSWPLHDAARALQFVRSKAREWNIDKARIAASGGSAGACSSLWLALHDDLADPQSDDPVARESTRLWCAAVSGAQTTLDPQQMQQWTPNSRYGGHAFGFMPDPRNRATRDTQFAQFLAARERILPWIRQYSPYEHVSPDDPPIYMIYPAPPALGEEQRDPTHTANFGVKLQERLREAGVECELVYPGAPDVEHPQLPAFVIEKLQAASRF